MSDDEQTSSEAAAPSNAPASADPSLAAEPNPPAATSALEDAWVIFGASSGIARPFARLAAQHGKALVLAGRDVEDLALDGRDLVLRGSPAVRTLPFDAEATGSFAAIAQMLDAALPQPFNVLLAFAVLPRVEDLERDPERARQVMAINAGAALALLQSLAPVMVKRGAGRLVVLGSVAGERVRPRNPIYGASKLALHGYVEAVRPALERAGLGVTLVKPGPIDTPMTYGLRTVLKPASADECAQAMWRGVHKGRRVVYFPAMLRWVMLAVRVLPGFLFARLNR